MADHRCRYPQEPCDSCEAVTEAQRRLGRSPAVNRTRRDYRRAARWLELEAERGYASSWRSVVYAQTMRWCAELAGLFGDGTFQELLQRSGHPHPYPKGLPETEAEWLKTRRVASA